MKTHILIKNLRQLFGFGRYLFPLLLAIGPYGMFPGPIQWFGEVRFSEITTTSSVLNPDSSTKSELVLGPLRGSLSVRSTGHLDAELKRLNLTTRVPSLVLVMLSLFAFSDTAWRLFRNAERGEIFSSKNACLIRRLGWVSIANGVLGSLISVWTAFRLGQYLASSGALNGVGITPGAALSENIPINSIVLGTSLLILAEVFRHGLALKQEADLTV